jgi:hypothetical protein
MAILVGNSVNNGNSIDDDGNDFFKLPIADWKFVTRVIFDIIMLTTLAIILGFVIDFIVPSPTPNEDIIVTVWLLFTQMVIATIILLFIEYIYIQLFGRSTSTYFVSDIFVLIFFISQQQIFARVYLIAKKVFGLEITLPAFPEAY